MPQHSESATRGPSTTSPWARPFVAVQRKFQKIVNPGAAKSAKALKTSTAHHPNLYPSPQNQNVDKKAQSGKKSPPSGQRYPDYEPSSSTSDACLALPPDASFVSSSCSGVSDNGLSPFSSKGGRSPGGATRGRRGSRLDLVGLEQARMNADGSFNRPEGEVCQVEVSEEIRGRQRAVDENQRIIDGQIDQLSAYVENCKYKATVIGQELREQNVMLDGISERIDRDLGATRDLARRSNRIAHR